MLTGVRSLRSRTVSRSWPASRCSRSAWCLAAAPGCSARCPASSCAIGVFSCTLRTNEGRAVFAQTAE